MNKGAQVSSLEIVPNKALSLSLSLALMYVWRGQTVERTESVRQAREDRDGRVGGATMLQPLMLRLTCKAAAFAPAKPLCSSSFSPAQKNKTNRPSLG